MKVRNRRGELSIVGLAGLIIVCAATGPKFLFAQSRLAGRVVADAASAKADGNGPAPASSLSRPHAGPGANPSSADLAVLLAATAAGRKPLFATRKTAPARSLSANATADDPSWPTYWARWTIQIFKDAGLEMEDPFWMHLHRGHPPAPETDSVRLAVDIYENNGTHPGLATSGIELQYTVRGAPVSPWLPPPFVYTLHIDNPALNTLNDGFHDISVDVRGLTRNRSDFKPRRVFLHIARGRPLDPTVPIVEGDPYGTSDSDFGPGVVYVNRSDRRLVGYPMNPSVIPWHNPPYEADLYLEKMAPTGAYYQSAQMWWEDPPHPGLPFVRAMSPNVGGQDLRFLRVEGLHERFPFRDGPRGVGWMSPFTTGQVDSRGGFAHAEPGGSVRYLKPDGEIITVAGWRVRPGRDPLWILKPTDVVRRNMELRGRWLEGQYAGESGGFRTPGDVAIDPRNENIWYVPGYHDHVIWKVEIVDMRAGNVNVSVFAGDPNHEAGFRDGRGHAARFNGPVSVVFDPLRDVLYVADLDNDALRRVARDGTVTTLFGSPGMEERLRQRGITDIFNQLANRAASRYQVTPAEAAQGVRPEIFLPQTVRVRSDGDIVLGEVGFGGIRRINPVTGETRHLGNVFQAFSGQYGVAWAWLDVDRWGNSGPKDGIYWCKSVGADVDGETSNRFNEVYAWVPPEGGLSRFIFGDDWDPHPAGWGKREETRAPHYPWLVAVDPRGAVLISGFGHHGVSRLRVRRPGDPVPPVYFPDGFWGGRETWASGTGDGQETRQLASRSFALKFGWSVHNYLGFADAWTLRGDESDETLLNMFEATDAVRSDPRVRQLWLDFVRINRDSRAEEPLPPPTAANFYTLAPCRLADTREPTGGPALDAGVSRVFSVAGGCGIPVTAKAVSFNITVTEPSESGHLTLYPGGTSTPSTSNINFRAGQTRANNAILPLGATGTLGVFTGQASGGVHLILDVNGYFQ